MRSIPGANFTFLWNPSRGDNGPKDQAMGNLASYYRGNSYVDLIGMDVYDSAWNFYPGAAAEFQKILSQTWGLNWLASFAAAHNKPIAIPEMGLGNGPSAPGSSAFTNNGEVSGGDNPMFVTDMLNWIAHTNVVYFGFWDYQNSLVQKGQNPLAAQALQNGLTRQSARPGSETGG
jgi:hypothetical protein